MAGDSPTAHRPRLHLRRAAADERTALPRLPRLPQAAPLREHFLGAAAHTFLAQHRTPPCVAMPGPLAEAKPPQTGRFFNAKNLLGRRVVEDTGPPPDWLARRACGPPPCSERAASCWPTKPASLTPCSINSMLAERKSLGGLGGFLQELAALEVRQQSTCEPPTCKGVAGTWHLPATSRCRACTPAGPAWHAGADALPC